MTQWRTTVAAAILVAVASAPATFAQSAAPVRKFPQWTHLSSTNGDLPAPGPSDQQTASHAADLDKNGADDIVIGTRVTGPSLTWLRRESDAWTKYIIDPDFLRIEAGGASCDIDGDGDLDLIFGADAGDNKIWWWENPYPQFDAAKPWTRREIKNSGGNKHHDQLCADFDGDGKLELISWNQGGHQLLMFDVPEQPRQTSPWPSTAIYTWAEGADEHEGLAAADVNADGKLDIVGGGRWFEHTGGQSFRPHVIDESYAFSRAAAADLVKGGWLEVIFQPGDRDGRARWFSWDGAKWQGHALYGHEFIHSHSIHVADVDRDGSVDIFAAEMGQWGGAPTVNPAPRMYIFYGDGKGSFQTSIVAESFGNHESRLADLDGDGDLDILGKPYNWQTPRVDVWLQEPPAAGPLSRWKRHVVDYDKPWRGVFVDGADLDGDGLNDIVTGGWWYRNPGKSGGGWVRHTLGEPLRNMAALYDFDGDGDIDVLGTQGKGSSADAQLVLARNDGSGRFVIETNLPAAEGDFLQGVAVAEFREGVTGVALSWHQANAGVQLLQTTPRWQLQKIHEKSLDEQLTAGDIDRDGDQDLLLGTQWLENTPSAWNLHTLHEPVGIPDRNRLADLNGDGRLDAVVGFESSREPGKLAWYEQDSDPKSAWREHLIANLIGPMSMDVADMDSDGDADVILGQHNLKDPPSSRLIIFENTDGRGGAWKQHVVYTGDEHHDGSIAIDIDGDGDRDVISVGWTHPRVLLYENLAR